MAPSVAEQVYLLSSIGKDSVSALGSETEQVHLQPIIKYEVP